MSNDCSIVVYCVHVMNIWSREVAHVILCNLSLAHSFNRLLFNYCKKQEFTAIPAFLNARFIAKNNIQRYLLLVHTANVQKCRVPQCQF